MTLKIADLQTGYFAHPERPKATFPEVHAIKVLQPYDVPFPLCDQAVRAGFEYQWCSRTVEFTYVDCQKCRNILDNMAQAEGRKQLALFQHPRYV